MSLQAMAWALETRTGNPTKKLVLWGLANHAHKDGRNAWCSTVTLAEYGECDKRTVQRWLGSLLTDGMIREGDQSIVAHLPANQRPIVYDLAMSAAVAAQWAAERAATGTDGRRASSAKAGAKGGRNGADKRWGDRLTPPIEGPEEAGGDIGGDIWGDSGGDTPVTQTVGTSLYEREPEEPSGIDADASKPREARHQQAVTEALAIVRWYMDGWKIARGGGVVDPEATRHFNMLVGAGKTARSAQYVTSALLAGIPGSVVAQALAEHGRHGRGVVPSKAQWTELLVKAQGGHANGQQDRSTSTTDQRVMDWQALKDHGDGPAAIGGGS